MQINVETKPVASAAYNTRKKRLVETIDRLYHRNAKASLQKVISRLHPADMASILDELPPEHVVDVFYTISDTAMAAEVFSQLSPSLRTEVMTESPIEQLAAVLQHVAPDDLADLVGDLPEDQRAQLMALLDRESKDEGNYSVAPAKGCVGQAKRG